MTVSMEQPSLPDIPGYTHLLWLEFAASLHAQSYLPENHSSRHGSDALPYLLFPPLGLFCASLAASVAAQDLQISRYDGLAYYSLPSPLA